MMFMLEKAALVITSRETTVIIAEYQCMNKNSVPLL